MASMGRTVADKNIMVSSLELAIDATLENFGSRNIDEYLDKGGDQTQWRSTPNGNHMSALAYMVDEFIVTGGCTNGVIPTKKLQQAIEARNAAKRMNFSSCGNAEFVCTRGVVHCVHLMFIHTPVVRNEICACASVSYLHQCGLYRVRARHFYSVCNISLSLTTV